MRLPSPPPTRHLTYCLNIHPGESLTDVLASIRAHAPKIRDGLGFQGEFGLGLRLSHAAACSLEQNSARERLRAVLAENGFYVFTINGFPYGAFHGTRVKESVYQPDWTTEARDQYTRRLVRILADLLPEGVTGSISTVPLAYGGGATASDMGVPLSRTLAAIDETHRTTGREICLALEPEPDCLLQTSRDTLEFFARTLCAVVVPPLAARLGVTRDRAENLARRHLGLCLDTCHTAVQFEDPVEMLKRAHAQGIRVAKVQLSAALTCPSGADPLEVLAPFRDPVYLHQTRIRDATGTVTGFNDLDAALAAHGHRLDCEWRVHYHVPLYLPSGGAPGSTVFTLTPDFFHALHTCAVPHLEIETYTFDVLPPALRYADVDDSIIEEFRWVLARTRIRCTPNFSEIPAKPT